VTLEEVRSVGILIAEARSRSAAEAQKKVKTQSAKGKWQK
jgi:hypothetical protein